MSACRRLRNTSPKNGPANLARRTRAAPTRRTEPRDGPPRLTMLPRRELNPRFQAHIARARRVRILIGAFLGLCLLIGTGAALTQTQLSQHAAATLGPIASDLRNTLSQLPSALSAHISNLTPQLPSGNQLAAAATSFPQSIAENIRNLFCRWLECENATVQVEVTQQPPQRAQSYRATLPQNVKQPELNPTARSATTTSQVVVSNSPVSSPAFNPPTHCLR